MTVGANVKGCYFAIKSAEAMLDQLALKTTEPQAKEAYKQASKRIAEVKAELNDQVIFISKEEPQYKN